MDAIDYAKMMLNNTMYNSNIYGFNQYPATALHVPCPSECPYCGKALGSELYPIMAINNKQPNNINEDTDDDGNNKLTLPCEVVSIYRCTSCNELFAIWTRHCSQEDEKLQDSCEIISEFPSNDNKTSFSDYINKLSPDFVKIYNQAERAESLGLLEICGMGYRKALEFLVDAYVRHKNPQKDIKENELLGSKIDKYIDDDRIKMLTKKAVWIGNDQTHIMKKHTDRDISDIKKFINAAVHLIDMDFVFLDAESMK
jgi:hypothetical protein